MGLIVYWLVEASLFKCRLLINYIIIICYVIGYITIGCVVGCVATERSHTIIILVHSGPGQPVIGVQVHVSALNVCLFNTYC